ncbi:Phosphoinositide 3-kinase regulatory subunit 4 [Amphibalanus amphitrite]|uniref:non-specific serine/threonine protein kinase n=1 Tax=Amphibalanus amphitrite TaxID=1232801 RepID=A0A6A4VLI4_AMPAM|nr:Phosphoinositide 3-kinase regulatory subunit 4 [Amphibalanus amphitrite]
MGNQLAGIAPSQIFPVEYYLNDVPFVEFSASLGSTRFMKVARAHSAEGSLVVKVFVLHDPTLPLEQHKKKVDELKHVLRGVPNCLPFRYTSVTERSALLVRQYIRYSLYDRMSTRPFLTEHEKRWLSFQLLTALAACHRLGVCHGDLKLENLLVTSYLWLLDNPADFGYFFDTSRRRLCYVAPERFASGGQLPLADPTPGRLTPPMDVFAAGCCLAELWTEGGVPFDLPHLLLYRAGEYDPREEDITLLIGVAASCVRQLSQLATKVRALRLLLRLAVTVHIFPEYVLPNLAALAQDRAVSVRVCYAAQLAPLAESALRLLEAAHPALYELLDEVVPMVVHPSLWARQAAVGFICACAGQLRVIDVQCRLLPRLEPFLSHPVAALDSPAALLAALGPPVPRDVYDHLARASHLELLLATLSERQRLRRAGRPRLAAAPARQRRRHHRPQPLPATGLGRRGGGGGGCAPPDPPPVESDVERGEPCRSLRSPPACDPGLARARVALSGGAAAAAGAAARRAAGRAAGARAARPRRRAARPPWRPKGELVAHLHEHQGAVVRLATVADSPLVASAAADGQVRVWDVARMEGQEHRQPVPADTWSSSPTSALPAGRCSVYATMFGQLVGWDLRAPGTAWRLDNKARRGLVTALCADPAHCWLVVGTSSGVHVCWDLRFQLAVSTLAHPAGSRVPSALRPPEPAELVRQRRLRQLGGQHVEYRDRRAADDAVARASTRRCSTTLRDHHSQLVTWPAQQPVPVAGTYRAQVVDGIEVVQEVCQKVRRPRDDCPRGPEPTPPGHLDTISDIVLAKASQWYAVTASRDGVVKVWK